MMTRPRSRPAEATGGLAAVVTAIVALAGASTEVVAIVGTLAGLLPSAVTLLVANGGLRGAWRLLRDGHRAGPPRAPLAMLVAVVTVVGLALPAASAAVVPADARGFVDTIGVNTHLWYTDTQYNNYAMVKQRLRELGVRHVRDGFDPSGRQFFADRVNDLGAVGIKSTLIACDLDPAGGWRNLDRNVSDAKNKVRNSLDAVEGVNEPPSTRFDDTRGCQYWLNRLSKDGTYGSPLTQPIFGPSATGTSFRNLGSLSDRADGGNIHPYPGNEKPSGPGYFPFSTQMREVRQYNFEGRGVPVVATETGYHNAVNHTGGHRPVSERAAGIYMPRLFLEYARAGVARTFSYELVDLFADSSLTDEQDAFGLFRNDWSYKPAATALKNTIGLVDSPSPSQRATLGYTLTNTADPDGSGSRGPVKDYLVQKADGSWWLALWQDSSVWNGGDISNPNATVRVTLDRAVNVTGFRPTSGTGSVGGFNNTKSFNVGVGDDVILLKMTEATTASAPAPTTTVSSSSTSVVAGGQITVDWTAPEGSSSVDWISMFEASAPNTAYNDWKYTGGATKGTMTLTVPSTPGTYELRYLINDGFESTAKSAAIKVTTG